ncbi:2Fe-2S iron-sulfur cluster binding domain-containing protein [Pseudoduganella sp. FT26W]|uniref:2Fe-2S iron-sulfur cluster binding domain-containing protein n=1 Tax=Duganella aquatilis TaxID=2666082 RepID=A0A844D9I9_9BURK|nr:PDR/VanB family oxidoreductase [Duganella aquatilis]MRW84896.1 2Fe-2S iron-sulfur cluster binding domain-containing protein [Duganella aquatilis]
MRFKIARIIDHGAAVKEFHLRREDGVPLPAWQPGAHVLLRFAAADGRQFEKHYSLVGDAAPADTYRIAVQREAQGHGGSRCLHDEFGPGSAVELSGPFNSFPLHATPPSAARVLLIAGGIGITPMVSMAHALSAAGAPFALHYLAHSRDRLVLLDELHAIARAAVTPHVSQETGRADLAALLGPYNAGDSCYACGPVALLQALAATAAQLGWPAGALHVESFGARADGEDAPLQVELSLSQMTIDVPPGTTILDALIAADVFVSYDCKRGECGNCYTPVLEGQPLHRDVCLTPAMRATGMCTCVSWAAAPGRLVLEI